MSVNKLDYDEKAGMLTVHYSDGGKSTYFLVTPKVYEKSYDYKDLDKFVRNCLVGQFLQSDYYAPKSQDNHTSKHNPD